MRKRALAMAAFAALMLLPVAQARAQSGGFALDRFEPTPAGDGFFGVPSPYTASDIAAVSGYLSVDYAHLPLRTGDPSVAIVSTQAFLHADVSLAILDRLLLNVHMPFAIAVGGDDPAVPGTSYVSLSGPKLSDLRFGARVRIWGEDGTPTQVGAGGYFFVPTGSRGDYAGDGAVRGKIYASVGGRLGTTDDIVGMLWGASVGVDLHAAPAPHALNYGAGIALLLVGDLLQIGPEIYAQTALSSDQPLASTPVVDAPAGTNAEALLGAKLRVFGGLCFGAAIGPGLGSTIGTPSFRFTGLIGWSPLPGTDATASSGPGAPAGPEPQREAR